LEGKGFVSRGWSDCPTLVMRWGILVDLLDFLVFLCEHVDNSCVYTYSWWCYWGHYTATFLSTFCPLRLKSHAFV